MAEQIPLTSGEESTLTALYPANPNSILVAGQALATWVDVFQLPVPTALESGVTRDLDILGTREDASEHYRLLTDRKLRVDLHFPKFGDVTPNTAKLVVYARNGQEIQADIDYISALCGYFLEEEARLRERAIPMTFANHASSIKVMHPFDCLKSRVHNLAILTSKQNRKGVAQAHLAVSVMQAYVASAASDGHLAPRQIMYPLAEAVIDLAACTDGVRVFHEFGVDVMACIELHRFPDVFQRKRWPQALEFVRRRRFGRNGGTRPPAQRLDIVAASWPS